MSVPYRAARDTTPASSQSFEPVEVGCHHVVERGNLIRMKIVWGERERKELLRFLDTWFEETADWSRAVEEMQLRYHSGQPYPRLEVQGDFFYDAHLQMKYFALDCGGRPVLIAEDDEGHPSYMIIT